MGSKGPLNPDLNRDEIEDLVELLKRIGTNSFAARVLVSLSMNGPSDSAFLQKDCDLRQPEVSIAISHLKKDGIIQTEKTNIGGRGRPKHIYGLTGGFDDSIQPFVKRAKDKLAIMQEQISRLKEITDNI